MIITRTADIVEFRLSESRSVRIDIAQVSSVALAIGRRADGKLAPALEVARGAIADRVEASLECLTIMHGRIVELMAEISGPAMVVPGTALESAEPYPA